MKELKGKSNHILSKHHAEVLNLTKNHILTEHFDFGLERSLAYSYRIREIARSKGYIR